MDGANIPVVSLACRSCNEPLSLPRADGGENIEIAKELRRTERADDRSPQQRAIGGVDFEGVSDRLATRSDEAVRLKSRRRRNTFQPAGVRGLPREIADRKSFDGLIPAAS